MSRQTRGGGGYQGVEHRRINCDLFTLTYGALVSQLVKDYENPLEVNKQLDKMGFNIGTRIVEDYIAKSTIQNVNFSARCASMRELAEKLAQAFRYYLDVSPKIDLWNPNNTECSFVFDKLPLVEHVELPDNEMGRELTYCQLLCGVIRGALESLQQEVSVWIVKDQLKGDPGTEIRLRFIKKMEDQVPEGDDD